MIHFSRNIKRFILIAGDLTVFELSLVLTLLIRYGGITSQNWILHAWPFTIVSILWLFGLYIAGMYDLSLFQNPLRLFRTYLEGMIANLAVALGFFYLIPAFGIAPRTNLFLHFVVSLLIGYSWRLLYNRYVSDRFARGRILYIGPAEETKQVQQLLEDSSLGLDLVAAIPSSGVPDSSLRIAWKDSFAALEPALREHNITAIVLGVHPESHPELKSALYRSLFHPVALMDRAELEEATTGRIPLSYVSETWFLHHLNESQKTWYESVKRVVDVCLAIPFGLLTIVLLPFVFILTKLSSPGPLLIRQTRIGRGGKPFTLVKFRSMKVQSAGGLSEPNGPQFTTDAKTDPRLFTWGRIMRQLRIDELPQIWNVLRGDLSLIGPRPERPEFVAPLVERMPYYNLRHLTRPGLTGWAQVRFLTPTTSLEDNLKKLQYDLYYIKHRSIPLDLAILLKTIGIVIKRQGT